MSRINVDAVAFTDPRFGRFAVLRGYADADHARAKVEHLWLACTLRGETDLPAWLVEQTLGPGASDALVASELARWGRGRGDSDTRRLHICGTRGRVEWYTRNREQAQKGGKSRARTASRVAGRFVQGSAGDSTSALALALAHAPEDLDQVPPGESVGFARAREPAPAAPAASPAPPAPKPKPARPRSVAVLLPDGWSPRPAELELARSVGADAAREEAAFRDHHAARGSRFADWNAAFRTWLRNSERFARRAGPTSAPARSPVDVQLDELHRLEADERGRADEPIDLFGPRSPRRTA